MEQLEKKEKRFGRFEKRLLFIYNPIAGKEQVKGHLANILSIFVENGYETTVIPTRAKGDATELVKTRPEDFDLVVCCGGDGTLEEVVSGMLEAKTRIPIGYIPAGSTNDFGGSLMLPKDMLKAAEIAARGIDFPCDVGRFNGKPFIYVAAFGLFTELSYETPQEIKNVLGHAAYVLAGVKALREITSYHMRATFDGKTVEGDYIYGMVTNSLSVGGFKGVTGTDVDLSDGLLEVLLVHMPETLEELSEIGSCFRNRDLDSPMITHFHASSVEFTSDKPVAWTTDGEDGGHHRKAVIGDDYQAVQIRVERNLLNI